jgi:hypothetical protein
VTVHGASYLFADFTTFDLACAPLQFRPSTIRLNGGIQHRVYLNDDIDKLTGANGGNAPRQLRSLA